MSCWGDLNCALDKLRSEDMLHLERAPSNKPLVPTRNGEAPLLAAQRRR